MKRTWKQGFINLFRNLPFAGPVIEECQNTCPRERTKYAIKRAIISAAIVAGIGATEAVVDAFFVIGAMNIGRDVIGHEVDYFSSLIDEMDDKTFDRLYTALACGPLAPWLFDSKALRKVLRKAWKGFEITMGEIRKFMSKLSKIVWEVVDSEIGLDLASIGVSYFIWLTFPPLGVVMLPAAIISTGTRWWNGRRPGTT